MNDRQHVWRAMSRGIFVAGTDTGIGKTTVACALLRTLAARGHVAVGMKPVASGVDAGRCNDDVAALAAAGNVEAPLTARNPYAFAPAVAPHLAARQAGRAIDLGVIAAAYRELDALAQRIVVESAGGALTPLDDRFDMLDIARVLDIPVVLVVGIRLGCINHALLTALAVRARGLRVVGWIANCIDPTMPMLAENIAALECRLPVPRLASLSWGFEAGAEWISDEACARLFPAL